MKKWLLVLTPFALCFLVTLAYTDKLQGDAQFDLQMMSANPTDKEVRQREERWAHRQTHKSALLHHMADDVRNGRDTTTESAELTADMLDEAGDRQ